MSARIDLRDDRVDALEILRGHNTVSLARPLESADQLRRLFVHTLVGLLISNGFVRKDEVWSKICSENPMVRSMIEAHAAFDRAWQEVERTN